MKTNAKVGGRRTKGDCRDVFNWTGSLSLKATNEGDQFWLAAVYRLLTGRASGDAEAAMSAVAKQCERDYQAMCKAEVAERNKP
jgi:hypothetical protein